MILSRVFCALPAWDTALLNKTDAFLAQSNRFGFVNSLHKLQLVLDSAMKILFRKMQPPDHCLRTLLSPDRPLRS